MLKKIISGGQTGADQSGLRAAKNFGIMTGGWLPKGCITMDGPCPDLLEEYNMQEHESGYALRTEANVRDSDGTIRFASNFKSPGERCTLKAIKWFKRPYIDVNIVNPRPWHEVILWISENRIETLNIAGNSEYSSPGIDIVVYEYLSNLLPHCLSEASIKSILSKHR